jgi:hypothetical protein
LTVKGWGLFVLSILAALFAGALCALATGCNDHAQNTAQPDPRIKAMQTEAAEHPALLGLFDSWLKLGKDLRDSFLAYGKRLERRQEMQNSARHWLIAGAVVFGLFALLVGAGKFFGRTSAAATPYAAPLVWLSQKVSGWSVILAALACAGCICAAIWIGPLWALGLKALCIAGAAGMYWLGWETSALRHTGPWTADGLVRLPKGWRVAKE